MIEQPVVITARHGDIAWVQRAAPRACTVCDGGGCGAERWLRWLAPRARALTLPGRGLVAGQRAVLELDERWLARVAGAVYGAPLAGLLAGAAFGQRLGGDAGAAALGAAGLAAGAVAAAVVARRYGTGKGTGVRLRP